MRSRLRAFLLFHARESMQLSALIYRIVLPLGVISAGAAALVWLQYQKTPPARTAGPTAVPIVRVATLGPTTSELQIVTHGVVRPVRETKLAAEVAGRIVEKSALADSGKFATAETPLVVIDDRTYQLEANTRAAEVDQARAELKKLDVEQTQNERLLAISEREQKLADSELERLTALAKQNASARADVDEAERAALRVALLKSQIQNSLDLIPLRRDALGARLAAAEASWDSAQLDLERTRVVAPHDGIVIRDVVEAGDFVQKGDVLLTIEDTSAFEVAVRLRTEQLYWIWDADGRSREEGARRDFEIASVPAVVSFEVAGREFRWRGELDRVEGAGIDETTQTATCRVMVREPTRATSEDGPRALVRGMFVKVTLNLKPQTPLLDVPQDAIRPNGRVWSIESGKLRLHHVAPIETRGDHSLLRADSASLKPGDRVVVSPLRSAYDGMSVREDSEP